MMTSVSSTTWTPTRDIDIVSTSLSATAVNQFTYTATATGTAFTYPVLVSNTTIVLTNVTGNIPQYTNIAIVTPDTTPSNFNF